MAATIRLYWWSEMLIQKLDQENYGDVLGKYLVEKIAAKKVIWQRANKFYLKNLWSPLYVTIGSILEHIGAHCTVWGSGIISRDAQVAGATFLAVRGPLSRERLLELGYNCPAIYGDPALLLPRYYQPQVDKKFHLGIIPHINDYEEVNEWYKNDPSIKVINFRTNDVEETTRELLECGSIVSSSLHGVIVAHAYHIPAVQVTFSDRIYGDGVKYHDYYLSVGLETYDAIKIDHPWSQTDFIKLIEAHNNAVPQPEKIQQLQDNLLAVCPFKAQNHE
ncbi:polysaccharide pyruvyl transferase family protein [Nonlabens sp.]|uniref:polysaccharide pyruvyl transferase family protein n=1 Tax=Nonlabens sp. TaxID=1888209 RepID=UPI003F6A1F87